MCTRFLRSIAVFAAFFFVSISFLPTAPLAGAPAGPSTGGSSNVIAIYLENDIFASTDEEYTHGCGVTWISKDFFADEDPFIVMRPFFKLLSLLGTTGYYRNVSLSFRQNIYTPEDISNPNPIPDDTPYAGVTYFPIGFHQKGARRISSLEMDIGMLGPHSYAADSQKKVHQVFNSKEPEGWDNQLEDEFILNLNYDRRWRFYERKRRGGAGIDVIPFYGYGVGNMKTYVGAGAQLRAGWHLPRNFGSYLLQPSCECSVPPGRDEAGPAVEHALAFFFFASFQGDLVLRDIFLDGNTFKESNRVDKKLLTGQGVIGVGFKLLGFRLNYTYVLQTRRFKGQKKAHVFGGVTLSVEI